MIRTKICGITRLKDALFSVGCGVDALGFNFYKKSPRYVSPNKAYSIISQLPPFVSSVGLFVNEDYDEILKISDMCGIRTIQLHGDESPDFCGKFDSYRVIKAFRIKDESDLENIKKYDLSGYILDSFSPDLYGGTGLSFDWGLLDKIDFDGNIIVAGGINPDNIERLLRSVVPYGVDICSGVESSPGVKDDKLLKEIMSKIMSMR